MTHQKSLLHQIGEGRLGRVRAGFVLAHHVTGSDPAVGLHVIHDVHRQFRQCRESGPLPLHLRSKAALLLLQRAQKEQKPRLPVSLFAVQRALRPA